MEIKATIIAHSINLSTKSEIITFELEYPRFIHSELMTHRVFSRNAMSSRAVPIEKMMLQVLEDPAHPVYWGLNQSGMQAKEEHEDIQLCMEAWQQAAKSAVDKARFLQNLGLHKQIVNRLLEPFQMMKTIVTSTEWENFFELRCHPDAQPEFQHLANLMNKEAYSSIPDKLGIGEWHLPYVGKQSDYEEMLALKISASCCAQVSYRKTDDSVEKAIAIYDRLVASKPAHASPFEHQAQAIEDPSHWSGNFQGWLQYRKVLGL